MTRNLLRTVTALALLAPGVANAGKVVLTPLIMDATITAKQRLAVHQLVSSELDFAPEVDGVVDLDAAPPTLDEACIANAKCLAGIASANGGDHVLTGKMSGSGANYVLELVYFDGTRIARRKAYTVPQDPTALANQMTPIVRELLTGSAPTKTAAAAPTSSDFEADDEIDLGGDPLADLEDAPDPAPSRPAPARPAPAPAAPSRETDRRVAAASAATGLVTGGAPAPAPAANDEELAKMISFGGSVNDITAEEIDQIKFGAPPGVSTAPEPVVRSSRSSDPDLEEEEAEMAMNSIQDLDGGKPTRASTPRTSSRPSSGGGGGGGGSLGHIIQVTGRGGFTKYYKFSFATGGGEAALAVAEGLHLVAGVEVYGVKRVLPPELQISTGIYSQWNFIFPMNVGAIYKIPVGKAQPYVGADAIFVQYYKDALGADWAGGGRVRAGVDYMIIPNFGLNLNLAAGAWSGQNWGLIEQGVGTTGFLPQVSAGTVIAF